MSYLLLIFLIFLLIGIVGVAFLWKKKPSNNIYPQLKVFTENWRTILLKILPFYGALNTQEKQEFEQRILLFFNTKKITAVDTEIDDTIRLMVASSAIIPMFAFPEFNYPGLKEILIYPNSFDEKFQTERFEGHKEIISGMVGNRFMNGNMILSKPDLVKSFDGKKHKENLGIHEFIHLIDKTDGVVDGVPEILIKHQYVKPWLHLIMEEKHKIEAGHSDINPYGLMSNAEFLAVVGEYFFYSPEKFKRKHKELYHYMNSIFHKKLN